MLQGYYKITLGVTSGLNKALQCKSITNLGKLTTVINVINIPFMGCFQSDKFKKIPKMCHFEPFKRVTDT